MNGYFKKDVYLYKKMFWIAGATFLLFLVFGFAFRFSYEYGNLAKYATEELVAGKKNCEILFPFLAGFSVAGELAFFSSKTIDADRSAGYFLFSYTLAETECMQAKAKVLEVLTSYGISITAELLYGFVFGCAFGFENVGMGMWFGVMVCTVICLISSISVPLTYKMKKSDTAVGVLLLACIAVLYLVFGCVILFGNVATVFKNMETKMIAWMQGEVRLDFLGFFNAHACLVISVMIMVCLVSVVITYWGSKRQLARRDVLCQVSC